MQTTAPHGQAEAIGKPCCALHSCDSGWPVSLLALHMHHHACRSRRNDDGNLLGVNERIYMQTAARAARTGAASRGGPRCAFGRAAPAASAAAASRRAPPATRTSAPATPTWQPTTASTSAREPTVHPTHHSRPASSIIYIHISLPRHARYACMILLHPTYIYTPSVNCVRVLSAYVQYTTITLNCAKIRALCIPIIRTRTWINRRYKTILVWGMWCLGDSAPTQCPHEVISSGMEIWSIEAPQDVLHLFLCTYAWHA